MFCAYTQRRLWRDCADAQARLSYRYLPMKQAPISSAVPTGVRTLAISGGHVHFLNLGPELQCLLKVKQDLS